MKPWPVYTVDVHVQCVFVQLMLFGLLICLDAYLFTFTFLPVRVLLSLIRFLYRLSHCR